MYLGRLLASYDMVVVGLGELRLWLRLRRRRRPFARPRSWAERQSLGFGPFGKDCESVDVDVDVDVWRV